MDAADSLPLSVLSEETQSLVRKAMESHEHCAHEDSDLCFTMTLLEVEVRRDEELTEDEIGACNAFITDCVLEGLILKGIMEPFGIDLETGDFVVGLTAAGEDVVEDLWPTIHGEFEDGAPDDWDENGDGRLNERG